MVLIDKKYHYSLCFVYFFNFSFIGPVRLSMPRYMTYVYELYNQYFVLFLKFARNNFPLDKY